jgi:nucleotide-binding universal stress UspA family protein
VSTFRTIVVAVDFSDNALAALQTAVRLADDLGAQMRAVHVVTQSALRMAIQEGIFAADDDDAVVRTKVRAFVERQFAEFFEQAGIAPDRVEQVIMRGDPSRELVGYIRDYGGDLIVVGRRGKTLADVLLGSVAERVVRHASCPVLIVKRS